MNVLRFVTQPIDSRGAGINLDFTAIMLAQNPLNMVEIESTLVAIFFDLHSPLRSIQVSATTLCGSCAGATLNRKLLLRSSLICPKL